MEKRPKRVSYSIMGHNLEIFSIYVVIINLQSD